MNEKHEVQPSVRQDAFSNTVPAFKVVDSATGRVKYDLLPTAAHAEKMREFADHISKPLQ